MLLIVLVFGYIFVNLLKELFAKVIADSRRGTICKIRNILFILRIFTLVSYFL